MISEELDELWEGVDLPEHGELAGRALPQVPGLWVALDAAGRRHLLVEVPDDHPDLEPTSTRGLSATVTTHRVADHPAAEFIDLACLDTTLNATFSSVASDIGSACEGASPNDRVAIAGAALNRWRWFWGVEVDRLSSEDALGLFAELWFLRRWLGPCAETVASWTAPAGARHDFQWGVASVEVKGTSRRGDGGPVHRIHGLEQLADPERGVLYLFSLHLTRDELATNTLPSIVAQIEADLGPDQDALREFDRRLADRGYSPASAARHSASYRVLQEHLYEVRGDFPRLTAQTFPDGLPPGISGITYALAVAACAEWLVATDPAQWDAEVI